MVTTISNNKVLIIKGLSNHLINNNNNKISLEAMTLVIYIDNLMNLI